MHSKLWATHEHWTLKSHNSHNFWYTFRIYDAVKFWPFRLACTLEWILYNFSVLPIVYYVYAFCNRLYPKMCIVNSNANRRWLEKCKLFHKEQRLSLASNYEHVERLFSHSPKYIHWFRMRKREVAVVCFKTF